MKAFCLLHDHVSDPGLVGEALVEQGWTVETALVVPADRFGSPDVTFDFPDPTDYDLLVPFGAPWSVYDHDRIGSWVKAEVDWIREALTADVPVLGVCFGGQLLSEALGGTVSIGREAEIGWVEVESSAPEVVPAGPWFEWHYDAFTVPPGARSIARNDVTEQAFVHRRSLGVQFHPELTPEVLDGWIGMGGDAKARAIGLDPADLVAATAARVDESRERTRALVEGYLEHVF